MGQGVETGWGTGPLDTEDEAASVLHWVDGHVASISTLSSWIPVRAQHTASLQS